MVLLRSCGGPWARSACKASHACRQPKPRRLCCSQPRAASRQARLHVHLQARVVPAAAGGGACPGVPRTALSMLRLASACSAMNMLRYCCRGSSLPGPGGPMGSPSTEAPTRGTLTSSGGSLIRSGMRCGKSSGAGPPSADSSADRRLSGGCSGLPAVGSSRLPLSGCSLVGERPPPLRTPALCLLGFPALLPTTRQCTRPRSRPSHGFGAAFYNTPGAAHSESRAIAEKRRAPDRVIDAHTRVAAKLEDVQCWVCACGLLRC
jgi:hypothetical protein